MLETLKPIAVPDWVEDKTWWDKSMSYLSKHPDGVVCIIVDHRLHLTEHFRFRSFIANPEYKSVLTQTREHLLSVMKSYPEFPAMDSAVIAVVEAMWNSGEWGQRVCVTAPAIIENLRISDVKYGLSRVFCFIFEDNKNRLIAADNTENEFTCQ